MLKGCDKLQISEKAQCPKLGTTGNNAADQPEEVTITNISPEKHNLWVHNNDDGSDEKTLSVSKDALVEHEAGTSKLVYGVFFTLSLVSLLLIWVLYAYRNPHTKSGQFLIQVSILFLRFVVFFYSFAVVAYLAWL